MQVYRGIVISFPSVEEIGPGAWEARGVLAWAGQFDAIGLAATPVVAHTKSAALSAATERARRDVDDAFAIASKSTPLGALQRVVLDAAKLGEEIVEVSMSAELFERVVRESMNGPQPPRQTVGLPIGLFLAISSPTLRGATAELKVQTEGRDPRITTIDLSVDAPAGGYA